MAQSKLTVKERSVAMKSLMGEHPTRAYGDLNRNQSRLGKQLVAKENPLTYVAHKKRRQADAIVSFWVRGIEKGSIDMEQSTIKLSDAIKMSELMAKYIGLLDGDKKEGDVYNTMIIQDVKALTEDELMKQLAVVRERNNAIDVDSNERTAVVRERNGTGSTDVVDSTAVVQGTVLEQDTDEVSSPRINEDT